MTKISGVPDRDSIKPGMAYFAGSGPVGKTCGDCSHRGDKYKGKTTTACAMYFKLTGVHGVPVNKYNHCCKYFQERVK